MLTKQLIENARDVGCHQTATEANTQSQPRKLVDDRQAFELPAILGLVVDKSVAPHVVGIFGPVHPLRSHAKTLPFAALLHHLQTLRAPDLADSFTTDRPGTTHQIVDLAVAEVGIAL